MAPLAPHCPDEAVLSLVAPEAWLASVFLAGAAELDEVLWEADLVDLAGAGVEDDDETKLCDNG